MPGELDSAKFLTCCLPYRCDKEMGRLFNQDYCFIIFPSAVRRIKHQIPFFSQCSYICKFPCQHLNYGVVQTKITESLRNPVQPPTQHRINTEFRSGGA